MLQDLRIWLNHFEYHAEHPRTVPAGLSDVLKPEERKLISRSIATFQLGEQSEGTTLLRSAEKFAQALCSDSGRTDWRRPRPLAPAHETAPAHEPPPQPAHSQTDHPPHAGAQIPTSANAPPKSVIPDSAQEAHPLVRLTELFIREEQRHAALLLAFMEDHNIPRKHHDWTDRVFRLARRLAGFELYLHVLITAELIGNVYYRALEAATGCQRLKVLCRTLVADELAHVGYESALLLALAERKPSPVRWLQRAAHRTFFLGAVGVVWLTHRGVLKEAGYQITSFVQACLAQYAFYLAPPRTASLPASLPKSNRRPSPQS